jgi:hypothetical protein
MSNTQLSPTALTGAVPDMFPSDVAKVAGHGCAGTSSNVEGAAGNFVPYQEGGGVCLSETAAIGGTTGPSSGHAAVQPCGNMVRSRDLALGAGKVAQVGRSATLSGGKKRKTRLCGRKGKTRSRGRKGKSRSRGRKGKSRSHGRKGKSRSRGRKGKSRSHGRARTFRGRRSRKQRGGRYHQTLTNVPYSQGYQAAGVHLPASQSALASPVPYTSYANCSK